MHVIEAKKCTDPVWYPDSQITDYLAQVTPCPPSLASFICGVTLTHIFFLYIQCPMVFLLKRKLSHLAGRAAVAVLLGAGP